jgi:hypothetical protein
MTTSNKKAPDFHPALLKFDRKPSLLDFAFLIFDVLARNGVVFVHDQLFSLCAGVFLGHVKVASVR